MPTLSKIRIVNSRYSPSAALAEASALFDTKISVRTLYRYIDNHVFYMLDSSYLPIKGKKKKKKYNKPVQKESLLVHLLKSVLLSFRIEIRLDIGKWILLKVVKV